MTKRQSIVTVITFLLLTVILIGCGGKASLSKMTPSELYDEGMSKYNDGKYLRSVELFQALIYNYPGETVVDTAQYYLGMSYFNNNEQELAAVEFNRLAVNYPSSAFFEDALFMKAVSYYKGTPSHYGLDQVGLEKAIQQFEDFIIDFPESHRLNDAREALLSAKARLARKYYESATVYRRIGAYRSAKIYLQKVIDEYTDTKYGPMATFEFAYMDYKMKSYDDARRGFENFVAVFPEHELAAEATVKIVEAAFKAAEADFKAGRFSLAREKLEEFKHKFPNNDKIDKVDEYLKDISEKLENQIQVTDADSAKG